MSECIIVCSKCGKELIILDRGKAHIDGEIIEFVDRAYIKCPQCGEETQITEWLCEIYDKGAGGVIAEARVVVNPLLTDILKKLKPGTLVFKSSNPLDLFDILPPCSTIILRTSIDLSNHTITLPKRVLIKRLITGTTIGKPTITLGKLILNNSCILDCWIRSGEIIATGDCMILDSLLENLKITSAEILVRDSLLSEFTHHVKDDIKQSGRINLRSCQLYGVQLYHSPNKFYLVNSKIIQD